MNDRSRRKEKLIDGSISWKIGTGPLHSAYQRSIHVPFRKPLLIKIYLNLEEDSQDA